MSDVIKYYWLYYLYSADNTAKMIPFQENFLA